MPTQRCCYLCASKKFERVKGKVRDLPRMPILKCSGCGLLFLAGFNHIHDGFYAGSLMRKGKPAADWRRYLKECSDDDAMRAEWIRPIARGRSLLDFGCGAGGFLDRARRFSKECAGVEKDDRLRQQVKGRFKVRVFSGIEGLKEKFDLITLFHVLEHFKDPRGMLKELSGLLNKGGRIVIEVPNSNDALLSLYGNKSFSQFTFWKCHLYSFNRSNLALLLRSAGLKVERIIQKQRYPLSNHLYWLAKGLPGGHKVWGFIDSMELNEAYKNKLSGLQACDTLIAVASRKKRAAR